MRPPLDLPRVAVIRVHRAGVNGLAIQVLQVDPQGDRDMLLGHASSTTELCSILTRWVDAIALEAGPRDPAADDTPA